MRIWRAPRGSTCCSRATPADGVHLSPSIRLLATPGHTPQDLTVLVGTADGIVALTHLWWADDGPLKDPYAADADRIVPGHGTPFTPGYETPR